MSPRRSLALLALAGLVAGCGGDPAPRRTVSSVGAAPVCSPPPVLPGGLPATFPVHVALPRDAGLTSLDRAGAFSLASGRVHGTVPAVLAQFRAALPAAGLFVGHDEDEGRGGQLSFLGASTEGVVTVARATCPAGSVQFTLSARSTR